MPAPELYLWHGRCVRSPGPSRRERRTMTPGAKPTGPSPHDEVSGSVELMAHDIPAALWTDLADTGLVRTVDRNRRHPAGVI